VNNRHSWSKESGASLVAIMVSMAIFGVVAVMASQSFRNISFSGRRVEAAMSAREAENVILQSMVQKFRDYIVGSCPQAVDAFFEEATRKQIGTLATINHKNVRFYNSKYTATVNPPSQAADDLKRCRSTPFASAQPINADTFYGCFDLETVAASRNQSSADAFSGNRGAFIEMYVKLRNLKTDTASTCANMIIDRGFGFEVYYALHWTTPAGEDVLYDTKLGTFNVAYKTQ
jgi:type II secretory pathway pseudopilin PulG